MRHPTWLVRGLPLLRGVFQAFFVLFTGRRVRRSGPAIPASGGLLILANHLADVDPMAIQAVCPRPIYFMAKSELFEMRVIGSLLRTVRAFPVKRGAPDRAALKRAIELLKEGGVVAVFPEGQLSETGELQPLLPGVALIARQAGVPVVCCRLDGTAAVMPYGSVTPRFCWGSRVSARWSPVRERSEGLMEWATAELSPK